MSPIRVLSNFATSSKNHKNRAKIEQNFQNFDFPEIAPRYFLRVPGASTALCDPPRASFQAGLVESRDQPPLFEKALPRRNNEPGSEAEDTSAARSEKKKSFLNFEPLVAKTLLLGRPVLSWATGDGLLSISVPPGRQPRPLVDMEASYGWRPASIDGRPHQRR